MTNDERSPDEEMRNARSVPFRHSASGIPSFDICHSSSSLRGHLQLTCGLDSLGRTSLRRQSFRAPMHVSKPHLDGNTLVVNVINPTAGLLEGDVIRCDIQVESGARLLLTTPSASRAHCMKNGWAHVEQKFHVAAGGWLENWPELFIPQANTRYCQETAIDIEPGGTVMYWEFLAPGRVASGEVFAFTELDWRTRIFFGGLLAASERYRLAPEEPSVEALRRTFPTAYYGSGFVFSPLLSQGSCVWQEIHDMHDSNTWIGCSALALGGWSIRVVAGDSVRFRKALAGIRRALYSALAAPVPDLRRAGV